MASAQTDPFAVKAQQLSDPKLRTYPWPLSVAAWRCALTPCAPAAVEKQLQICAGIRDQIELIQSNDYPLFLKALLPVFLRILRDVRVQFVDSTPEQKLRNTVLDILHKLPTYDALRPYVPDLAREVLKILEAENEDNAVVCQRIIIELHKSFRQPPILEDQVQPFFVLVQRMYQNLPHAMSVVVDKVPDKVRTRRAVVAACLCSQRAQEPSGPYAGTVPAAQTGAAAGAAAGKDSKAESKAEPRQLVRSMYSFKVLTECPILIVLLFQLHRKFIQSHLPQFVPLIIRALSLQPAEQARIHSENPNFVGMSPAITDRAAYNDFIAAQVKVRASQQAYHSVEMLTRARA